MITLHREPFKDIFDRLFEQAPMSGVREYFPTIHKSEDDYKIVMPVPGLTKDDLTIKVLDGILSISYDVEEMVEGSYSFVDSFRKSYRIPDDVKEKDITGKVENGVMEIVLPKNKRKPLERLIQLN